MAEIEKPDIPKRKSLFEITIPGSLYDISADPQSKLMEIANMLNEDYPEIDMVKLAENLKSKVVKKGKGIQIKFTISTKEEKELLDYFIGDLAGFAEQYYGDPLDPSEKARAKRAYEAGYNALEKLKDFTPPDTVLDGISSIDTSKKQNFTDYLKQYLEDNLDKNTGELLNEVLISEDIGGVSYQIKLQKAELFPTDIPDFNTPKGEAFIKNNFTIVEQQVKPNGEIQIDNFYDLGFDELDEDYTGLNMLNEKMEKGGIDQVINDYVVEIQGNVIPDTPTNVVDDIAQLENSLNEKYSDVLEFNYNAFGDDMASTKPLQIGLREDGVLGIDVISVSDSAQGQGYGSSIMNEIIEFADKNNLEIQLEPLEGQEEFFTKLGFEQFGDDEAEYRKLPTTISDNIAQQVDVQDVRIYFNEAYNKFNEEYMPWNYFENFLINEKELSEDVAKGIIDDIKVGLTKPEFTNFPQSTFDPNLFPKAGTNFDSAVSRNMFNSTQVQRELSAKYILEDVEDYLNLSEEQSTKLANTFYEGINPKTTGTVEFYVQQQSPNRILAGDVKSGLDMTHQVPGFYTEPIGNRSLSAIRGVGSNAPINNYYKVQVNTDNLLVDIAPARFAGTQGPLVSEGDNVLGRQINKINWDTFTKETGITYEMLGKNARIIDGQKYYTGSVQDLSRSLNTFQPNRNITGTTSTLSKTNVWEALRKSGIEGFVAGPVNVQYEIVFLDPNDNLGIGKRMNIQDATVQEFQTNKAAVTQLDELVIQPKPVTELNTYNQEDLNKLGSGNQIVDQSTVTQLDETTNAFKTQSNDIIQKLPIEKEVKDKIAKNIAELQVKWTTWSGPLELLDIYETGVMLFYGVVAAAPELKSYANTLMKDMYNTMIEFSGMENYGIKKLSGSDYEPNWSYIGEQIDKAEKIMPSEMLIKTIKEGAEKAGEENLMTGFGYIPPSLDTRKKLQTTLSNPKTPEKEDTGPSTYDKIKDTIGEWWKKPIVVYDR